MVSVDAEIRHNTAKYFRIRVLPGSDPKPEGDLGVQMSRSDDMCHISISGGSVHWDCKEECSDHCSANLDQVLGLFGLGARPGLHVQTVRPCLLVRSVRPGARPIRAIVPHRLIWHVRIRCLVYSGFSSLSAYSGQVLSLFGLFFSVGLF
ncbi:hypothetical protein L484_008297 [Morus notabilis]|uniref:Uncharacterized protein n=1 Tax=Morus notabilis TaxID=981085 RepID=W9R096_9ROSA|nr:hypothetical protein L484_008297 [Morus notabilis]